MHYQGHYLEIFGASMGLAWMCCPYPSGASWGPDLFLHTKLPSSINHGPAMLNFEIMCVSPWVSFGSSPIYSSDEPFWCNLSPLMIDWGPSSGSGIGADCSQLVGSEPRFPKVGQHQSTSKCNESVTFLVCSPHLGTDLDPNPSGWAPTGRIAHSTRPRTCVFTAERPTTTLVDAVWEFKDGSWPKDYPRFWLAILFSPGFALQSCLVCFHVFLVTWLYSWLTSSLFYFPSIWYPAKTWANNIGRKRKILFRLGKRNHPCHRLQIHSNSRCRNPVFLGVF